MSLRLSLARTGDGTMADAPRSPARATVPVVSSPTIKPIVTVSVAPPMAPPIVSVAPTPPLTTEAAPVSWLSSGLSKLGISKDAQRAAVGVASMVPGVGTAISTATRISSALSPASPPKPSVTTMSAFALDERTGVPTQMGVGGALPTIGGIIGRVMGRGGAIAGRVARSPIGRAVGTGVAGAVGWELGSRVFGGGNEFTGLLPSGYHYNKALRRYEIARANGRDVKDPRDEPRVKNQVVRNRSMNVLNPRALSRANTRICGFARVAQRTLRQLGYQVSTTRRAKAGKCKPKRGGCR